jgi:DNA invertase Pin-like site-specific DNA recombinase
MFIDNLKTNGKVYDRVRVYSIASSAYRKLPEVLRRIGYSTNQGDALCVWRCDRLSRNIVDSLEFIENIHKRGVMIYSYNEHINYKQNKMRFIQAIVDANKEAMIIGERIKLSNNFKRLRGDEKIGSLPYGKEYRNNGTHKIVVDNPQEQAIIRRIKTSKLKVSELVSQLNSEGIMKKNKKWNAPMVNRIKRS